MTERHIHHDPPTSPSSTSSRATCARFSSEAVPEDQREAVSHAIAVAGTATSLAAIAQELEPYDPEKVHGYVLSAGECRAHPDSAGRDARSSSDARFRACDPDRAPTIVAGVVILDEVMALLHLEEIEVSEHDILARRRAGAVRT